jgi:hypothetical protein
LTREDPRCSIAQAYDGRRPDLMRLVHQSDDDDDENDQDRHANQGAHHQAVASTKTFTTELGGQSVTETSTMLSRSWTRTVVCQ